VATSLKKEEHYEVDERLVTFLSDEAAEAEQLLEVKDLYDPNDPWAHYISMRLKQKNCFEDTNYIVRNGEVVIVDEFSSGAARTSLE